MSSVNLIACSHLTYSSSINHLREMYETEKLADVTIVACDNKKIKSHKFVLSRSRVFDAMLNVHDTKEAQDGVIEISDIDHDVLTEMLRYMYTDEIPKIKEMACKLLIAANKYDLQGLANDCEDYLIKNLTVENFVEALVIADSLELHQLKSAAIHFVTENRKNNIFASEEWKCLEKDHLELVLEILKSVAVAY